MSSSTPRPVQRIDRSGTRVDAAVALFKDVLNGEDITIGSANDDGVEYRYRSVGDGQVTVGSLKVAAPWTGTFQPRDQYVLAWTQQVGTTLDSDGSNPTDMRPGVPVMYPAARAFRITAAPGTQHMIRIKRGLLESVAAARRRDIPGRLTFRSVIDAPAAAALQRVIQEAAASLFAAATSTADRARLNLRIADAVVVAFDATPPSAILFDEGPATMRFAQEWMVANAHRPISIADVSDASGLAVRSLQASFQRNVGVSPLVFLRQIRLYRVRAELLEAVPGETSVAAIARHWNFAHLGRFSGYYSEEFGELPSTTIRRSPPQQIR